MKTYDNDNTYPATILRTSLGVFTQIHQRDVTITTASCALPVAQAQEVEVGGGKVALAKLDVERVTVRAVAHFTVAIVAVELAVRRSVREAEAPVEGTKDVLDRLKATGHMFS